MDYLLLPKFQPEAWLPLHVMGTPPAEFPILFTAGVIADLYPNGSETN